MNKLVEGVDTQVAYVLFEKKEDSVKALEANNREFREHHLRVTPADKKEQDVKTTIFIGNLSFNAKEEDVRRNFSKCGKIVSVRMIRDPVTFKGKGFAYIRFEDTPGFIKGLAMNKSMFMERELRITKAVNVEKKKKMQFKHERAKTVSLGEGGEQDIVKTKSKIMKDFAKKTNFNNDMTDTVADAIFQHQAVVPQSMVGKKIKNLKKKGFTKEKL
jgi:RNA recognition motif-containing protein